jgi:cyclophilin family peptidyl-prolyl cis-trans isomerase
VAGAFLLSRQFGDDKKATIASNESTTTLPAGQVAITVPPAGATIAGDTPCPAADGSAPRTTTFAKVPPTCIDPAKKYAATVSTSKGSFTISLDPTLAPNAVNNFVVLARYHYYDGLPFHRIISGFVDQTGDGNGPVAGQTDGPGYTLTAEPPPGADGSAYPEGAVAMAGGGTTANGSQWFVVVGNGGQQLQPLYSKLGTVASGLDVVQAINQIPTTNPDPPAAPSTTELVTVSSVTITEA